MCYIQLDINVTQIVFSESILVYSEYLGVHFCLDLSGVPVKRKSGGGRGGGRACRRTCSPETNVLPFKCLIINYKTSKVHNTFQGKIDQIHHQEEINKRFIVFI